MMDCGVGWIEGWILLCGMDCDGSVWEWIDKGKLICGMFVGGDLICGAGWIDKVGIRVVARDEYFACGALELMS